MHWYIVGFRTDASLFSLALADIATAGINALCSQRLDQVGNETRRGEDASPEKQPSWWTFCWLGARLDVFCYHKNVSSATFSLEQVVASLWDILSAVISTLTVDIESKISCVFEELAAANDKIGKLRADLQMGRNEMDHSRQRASAQCSWAFNKGLGAECHHYREMPVWEKRVRDSSTTL